MRGLVPGRSTPINDGKFIFDVMGDKSDLVA
jgi:hypothetical protein